MIHVDEQVLHDDTDGRCELDDGPALSPDTARRIACDAPFIAVLVDKLGKPMKVGKKTQAIPTAGEAGGAGPRSRVSVPRMRATLVHRRASHPLAFPRRQQPSGQPGGVVLASPQQYV